MVGRRKHKVKREKVRKVRTDPTPLVKPEHRHQVTTMLGTTGRAPG
jgi:hypothetical protein